MLHTVRRFMHIGGLRRLRLIFWFLHCLRYLCLSVCSRSEPDGVGIYPTIVAGWLWISNIPARSPHTDIYTQILHVNKTHSSSTASRLIIKLGGPQQRLVALHMHGILHHKVGRADEPAKRHLRVLCNHDEMLQRLAPTGDAPVVHACLAQQQSGIITVLVTRRRCNRQRLQATCLQARLTKVPLQAAGGGDRRAREGDQAAGWALQPLHPNRRQVWCRPQHSGAGNKNCLTLPVADLQLVNIQHMRGWSSSSLTGAGRTVQLPAGSRRAVLSSPSSTRLRCACVSSVFRFDSVWSMRPPIAPVSTVEAQFADQRCEICVTTPGQHPCNVCAVPQCATTHQASAQQLSGSGGNAPSTRMVSRRSSASLKRFSM